MSMPCITGARALVFVAACLAAQAASAADPLVNGSFTFSGLSYKLIDLDTGDGITPYVNFKSDSLTILSLYGARSTPGSQSLQGAVGPLVGGDLTLTKPSGASTASVSPTAMHAENALNLGDETKLILSANGRTARLELNANALSRLTFELSANTQLVVEGLTNSDVKVNLDALIGSPTLRGFGGNYGRITGNAFNIVSAFFDDPYAPRFSSRVDAAQSVTFSGVQPAPSTNLTYVSEDHDVRPFSLAYSNEGDAATLRTLQFSVTTNAYLSATVVPEASAVAYALFGAGGVLLASARRRRREEV